MSMITRINSAGKPQLLSASGDEWLDITDTEISEILMQQQQQRRQQWGGIGIACQRTPQSDVGVGRQCCYLCDGAGIAAVATVAGSAARCVGGQMMRAANIRKSNAVPFENRKLSAAVRDIDEQAVLDYWCTGTNSCWDDVQLSLWALGVIGKVEFVLAPTQLFDLCSFYLHAIDFTDATGSIEA